MRVGVLSGRMNKSIGFGVQNLYCLSAEKERYFEKKNNTYWCLACGIAEKDCIKG